MGFYMFASCSISGSEVSILSTASSEECMTTRIQAAVPEFEVLHNFPHFKGPEIYMILVWNKSQLSLAWKASVVLSPVIEFECWPTLGLCTGVSTALWFSKTTRWIEATDPKCLLPKCTRTLCKFAARGVPVIVLRAVLLALRSGKQYSHCLLSLEMRMHSRLHQVACDSQEVVRTASKEIMETTYPHLRLLLIPRTGQLPMANPHTKAPFR